MNKVGLSTPYSIDEKLFKMYKDAGIEYMEISVPTKEYDGLDFENIKKWSEQYGINIWSFHLPFFPFDKLDISRDDLKEASIKYHKSFIDKATDIGIDKFVIHASGEPIKEEDRPKRMACAKNSLYILAEYAKEKNAIILVEDLPRTCLGRDSSDILDLISAHPDLRVCFDTNHLLSEDMSEFIEKVGDKIVSTHISDYDFVNERHWLPGEGKIDWQGLINKLQEVNYNEMWLYELNMGFLNTINRSRELTLDDVVKNANELFEGKELTVISTPKKNLGFWD